MDFDEDFFAGSRATSEGIDCVGRAERIKHHLARLVIL